MIDKLNNHYSMNNPATVYDEEALTSLELAGRTTAKVNEMVDAFNGLESTTHEKMIEQDNAIRLQSDVIIPAFVKEEVQVQIENGTFDKQIDESLGNLTQRMDNIVGSLQVGSTSGDAELIDTRVDEDGNVWVNAGNSIRGQVKSVKNILADVVTPIYVPFTDFTTASGYYDRNTGAFVSHASYISAKIPVNPGEEYTTKCRYGYSLSDGVVLDANNNLIRQYGHVEGDAYTNFDNPMVIPENGAFLCLSSYASYGLKVRKLDHYLLKTDEMETYVENLVNVSRVGSPIFEQMATIPHDNYVIDPNGLITPMGTSTGNYGVIELAVSGGETLLIGGSAHHGNAIYSLYNDTDLIEIGDVVEGVDVVTMEKEIIIPVGCTKVYVAGYISQPRFIKKLSHYEPGLNDWSALKWVCLGDSLTEANIRTSKHYHGYVSDKTGIEVVNMGLSGSGYKQLESTSGAFYQRANDIPYDADVVTIFGSGNDLSYPLGTPTDTGTETLCGCINTTIDRIYAKLPTVQLGIVSPCPWGAYPTTLSNNKMALYSDALAEICKLRGIPFLDMYRNSGLRPWEPAFLEVAYTRDNGGSAHPDETGHKMMSSQFYNFLVSMIGTY